MEHIVYLIAVKDMIDLKFVAKHSKKIEQQLAQKRGLTYDFGAIVAAYWKKDYGEEICIGDNRLDTLVYHSNKEFVKTLDAFSYLILKGDSHKSLFDAYMRFFHHEQNTASSTDTYHLLICDFRDESNVFVGNEADEIIESFKMTLTDVSQISIMRKDSNSEAYERLTELMPELKKRIFTINAHGRLGPMSKESINIMLSSLS